ncbi:glycosyltransferase [Halochromatium sp.]
MSTNDPEATDAHSDQRSLRQRPRLAMIGFRPGSGGIGRVMITLVDALLDIGIEIDLLLPAGQHPDLEDLRGQVNRFTVDIDDHRQAERALRRYLQQRHPDAILSNKDQTHRLLRRRKLGTERPFTAFRVGTNVPERLKRTSPWTALWKRWQLAELYREADLLIGNSSGVSAALQRMLSSSPRLSNRQPRIETILNPVDAETIAALAAKPMSHPWLKDKTGPVILSVGRLVRAKNFGLLLRAFALLPATLNARLMICGSGSQHERLLALATRLGIAERVELLGHQSNPFRYVAAADLFVCSSIFEGANNALIEAIALGTPSVSTDCPSGAQDILDDGRLGPLVPVDNPQALADAMRSVLQAPLSAKQLRAGAARFDPKLSATGYAQALGLRRANCSAAAGCVLDSPEAAAAPLAAGTQGRIMAPRNASPAARIAIFAATSGHSGVDRILVNLIEQWAAWGLQVDLVQVRRHGPQLVSIPQGVRCIDLGTAHVNSALPALVRYLRSERPAALLSDKDRVNRIALLARWLAGSPTLVGVRLGTTVSVNLASRGLGERWLQRASIRYLYRLADRLLVPSVGVAEDLVEQLGLARARIQVVHSPIVSARLERLSQEPIAHPWLAAGEPPVILGVGELGARKDFATLVRAFTLVRAERPCRLIILGRGRRRERLQALASELGVAEALDLPGFVANPYPYMRRAAVFALSSRWEGLGIVLVEALACGTPTVSTDCPSGPREILGPCCPEALVPVGDHQALARVISATLADPPTPERLRKHAQAFSVEASARTYLEALGIPETLIAELG